MTKFIKDQFHGGEYLEYFLDPGLCSWDNRKFVARFKYSRGSKASFISFLIKNFSVEEYFGRLEAGEAPLQVLQSKGYLMPHIKKSLKAGGYEISQAGFDKMIQDNIAARHAAGRP